MKEPRSWKIVFGVTCDSQTHIERSTDPPNVNYYRYRTWAEAKRECEKLFSKWICDYKDGLNRIRATNKPTGVTKCQQT